MASTIWFDLDNSPHVPLFRPILAELRERGETVFVTAREFAQTKDLLSFWGIEHTMVGAHGGKSKVRKVLNLLERSSALMRAVPKRGISLAVSHGSRAQLVAAKRMLIPSILMLDYEYTENRIFNLLARHLLVPAAIPDKRLVEAGFRMKKVIRYEGFKEEIYLKDFVPDPGFRKVIGVENERILVTIRPPSMTGNYHEVRSEGLYRQALRHCAAHPNVHCLIVNRTPAELAIIPDELRRDGRVTLLSKPVDGLQLLWHSDVVISGGGTMNREAALLGVPTFSIFTGRRPYLDEHLQSQGRLTFIETTEQVGSIPFSKRVIPTQYVASNKGLAATLTELLVSLSEKEVTK